MLLHGFPQGVATHTPPATPVMSAGLCPCSTSLSRFPNVAKLLGQGIASPWGQPPLCGFFLTALGHCLFLVYTRSIGCTVFSCPLARGRHVSAIETFWLLYAQPVFSPVTLGLMIMGGDITEIPVHFQRHHCHHPLLVIWGIRSPSAQ